MHSFHLINYKARYQYYKYVHMLQINKWMPNTTIRFTTVSPFTIQLQQKRTTEITCRHAKNTTKVVSTCTFFLKSILINKYIKIINSWKQNMIPNFLLFSMITSLIVQNGDQTWSFELTEPKCSLRSFESRQLLKS